MNEMLKGHVDNKTQKVRDSVSWLDIYQGKGSTGSSIL